eukprot:3997910-Prymnesium_polylepis.1
MRRGGAKRGMKRGGEGRSRAAREPRGAIHTARRGGGHGREVSGEWRRRTDALVARVAAALGRHRRAARARALLAVRRARRVRRVAADLPVGAPLDARVVRGAAGGRGLGVVARALAQSVVGRARLGRHALGIVLVDDHACRRHGEPRSGRSGRAGAAGSGLAAQSLAVGSQRRGLEAPGATHRSTTPRSTRAD